MTVLSLFVRTPKTQASFADRAHRTLTTALRLSSSKSRQLKQYTSYLPRSLAPLLFLLRLPLLIFAIRQQVFLRPSPPFFAAEGTLQVLHSAKSITGQIVVGDNLADGYRYLRCDASLLGGRWTRPNPNGSGVELGDTCVDLLPCVRSQEADWQHLRDVCPPGGWDPGGKVRQDRLVGKHYFHDYGSRNHHRS